MPLLDDGVIEDEETFSLLLDRAENASVEAGTGVGTIADDDAPTVSVSLTTVREDVGTAVFTITLDQPVSQALTVRYDTVDGTVTGTVESESVSGFDPDPPGPTLPSALGDYLLQSGEVRFAPGETTRTVAVYVLDDQSMEPTEDFTLQAQVADAAGGEPALGAGTILDDDLGTLSAVDTTVMERDGATEIAVTLSPAAVGTVTVWYATVDLTALGAMTTLRRRAS